jgi:hypothetical protein
VRGHRGRCPRTLCSLGEASCLGPTPDGEDGSCVAPFCAGTPGTMPPHAVLPAVRHPASALRGTVAKDGSCVEVCGAGTPGKMPPHAVLRSERHTASVLPWTVTAGGWATAHAFEDRPTLEAGERGIWLQRLDGAVAGQRQRRRYRGARPRGKRRPPRSRRPTTQSGSCCSHRVAPQAPSTSYSIRRVAARDQGVAANVRPRTRSALRAQPHTPPVACEWDRCARDHTKYEDLLPVPVEIFFPEPQATAP